MINIKSRPLTFCFPSAHITNKSLRTKNPMRRLLMKFSKQMNKFSENSYTKTNNLWCR